ncbi:MAG: protoporphyrinogen/coproporphyrinogen oxidase [Chitinophagales bacterium]
MKYPLLKSAVLGKKLQKQQHYRIIGGGIAGLLLGFYLKKAGVSFHIYEKASRVGGLLQTKKTKFGIAEGAANGVLWCPEFEALANDLGLKLIAPQKITKKRYILRNNKFRRFPLTILETLQAARQFFSSKKPQKIDSLQDFCNTYLSEKVANQLLEPALAGIYAGRLHELSFSAILPTLAQTQAKSNRLGFVLLKNAWKNRKNKRPKAPKHLRGGSLSFENGMQDLVNALAKHLSENITYNVDVLEQQKKDIPTILCVPAYRAASFFKSHELEKKMNEITYSPIISITLFVEQKNLPNFKAGFGCLIPKNENYNILGVLFNHCIFEKRTPNENMASLTCIMRDFDGKLFKKTDEALLNMVANDLKRLFGLENDFLGQQIYRWPKGIPLYSPALQTLHFEIQELLEKDFPNIRIFGNYTGQISVRKMCQEAAKVGRYLAE